MCGPSQLPQQQCSRTRCLGMSANAVLIAAMCSSQVCKNSRSLWSWNVMVRSIAKSGASICNSRPAVDGHVFEPQLPGQRHEVALMRLVVGILHGCGDDARRGRGHEHFRKRGGLCTDAGLQAPDLAFNTRVVGVAYLADRLRGVGNLAARWKAPQEHFDQLGHFGEIASDLPL